MTRWKLLQKTGNGAMEESKTLFLRSAAEHRDLLAGNIVDI